MERESQLPCAQANKGMGHVSFIVWDTGEPGNEASAFCVHVEFEKHNTKRYAYLKSCYTSSSKVTTRHPCVDECS